jgi:biopolymer transport protein TolR
MLLRSQSALQSDINVTPLVDVCLVLLIIFMVVTPLVVTGVPISLPVTRHAQSFSESTRQLPVTVKDDGTVYVGPVVVRREQVAPELERLHREAPDRPVAVRGDARVAYGEVIRVLDACRAAGFSEVRLVSQQRE